MFEPRGGKYICHAIWLALFLYLLMLKQGRGKQVDMSSSTKDGR
jgi:hypothetical protein